MKNNVTLILEKTSDSLDELLLLWQTQPFGKDTNLIDYQQLVTAQPGFEQILDFCPYISWILDIRTRQFVFLSNNTELILGYPAGFFKNDGYTFLSHLMLPEDKKNLDKMTLELWKNLMLLPANKRQGYRFSRKYRLRNADGNLVVMREQNTVLQTDSRGNIAHVLGTCTDITELVNINDFEVSVQMPMGQPSSETTAGTTGLRTKNILSKREKQIVKLVAEGYSSKVIADQLFISFHTVNTHRKNIIGKTHSKNTSGLVQYAISNRLI
ncbi:MAG: hypothetical protein JWQ14_3493 [Adhaeribacter sp.]|nr:hypothetical protein [Adhaeribacter sp.]